MEPLGAEREPDVVTGLRAEVVDSENLRFVACPERSARKDWLHRGSREPLASMGLYHYEMFVYTVFMPAASVPSDCFESYVFARTHPECASRVQKLRLHEAFKVPRLNGVTMPRFEDDAFRNTMLKSMLFRPAVGVDRASDEVTPYEAFVDEAGDFTEPWSVWFEKQRVLARRCEELMAKARKVFVLEDVDVEVPFMAVVGEGRSQASPAEFMAHVTVEVVTNLELQACARATRPITARPDLSELERPDTLVEHVDGPPAGEEEFEFDGMPQTLRTELGKRETPVFLLQHAEMRDAAFHTGMSAAPNMKTYVQLFAETMGLEQLRTLVRAVAGGVDFSCGLGRSGLSFRDLKQKMEEMFKVKSVADVPDVEHGFDLPSAIPVVHPLGEAFMTVHADAKSFVLAAAKAYATRDKNPIVFNDEQMEVLAVVAQALDGLLKLKHQSVETALEEVKPVRILLCGQGGSGKTELVQIISQMLAYFEMGCRKVASSNSAARGVGGDTVHTSLHMHGTQAFTIDSLERGVTQAGAADWRGVECLIIEEVGMVDPAMFAGMSYRLCLLMRFWKRWLDPQLYQDSRHMFGGVPIVIMLGDFMQLAPIDRQQEGSCVESGVLDHGARAQVVGGAQDRRAHVRALLHARNVPDQDAPLRGPARGASQSLRDHATSARVHARAPRSQDR